MYTTVLLKKWNIFCKSEDETRKYEFRGLFILGSAESTTPQRLYANDRLIRVDQKRDSTIYRIYQRIDVIRNRKKGKFFTAIMDQLIGPVRRDLLRLLGRISG